LAFFFRVARYHFLFRDSLLPALVGEIVEGIHVFEKRAARKVAYPSALAVGVEHRDQRVSPLVELLVVRRFVDPRPPQDNAGMVSVPPHEAFKIIQGVPLPFLVSDVLPARKFGKDQKAQLVAGVQKVP